MRKLLLLQVLAGLFLFSRASSGEYAVDKIAPEKIKLSNVVVRKSEDVIEVKSLDKMVRRSKIAITILNEAGDKYAYLAQSYGRFTSIEVMEGALFDAAGKKIKSVKKAEIRDETGEGSNLADDFRYKYHSFHYRIYPYTVEYELVVVNRETMFFPSWDPLGGQNVSLEQGSLRVVVPKDYTLRYRNYNCTEPQLKDVEGSRKEYTWELKNVMPVVREYASPAWRNLVPYVLIAPSEFQIEDYKGDMKDWTEYGRFVASLNKGRDNLPAPVRAKVHQLTDGLPSKDAKVKALYAFLQGNTHYISIQLGIGGWRPFDAEFVATRAYGDCKALSNYMVALLKEAGIPSFYTLVKAGSDAEDIIVDFASSQYNHVIVCVPDGADSIWLECTSQTEVPGYMGRFTGNRHALLITEDGGKLVTTPHYGRKENLQIRRVSASINADGHMTATSHTFYQAMSRDQIHQLINGLSREKLHEYLKENTDLPNFDVKAFEYKEERLLLPSVTEKLDIVANHYAAVSGKRIFLAPNILTKSHSKPEMTGERKHAIELNREAVSIDSIAIQIPAGYDPEALPRDVQLDTKFGRYSASVRVAGDTVMYYRRLEVFSGSFPSADYKAFVAFWDEVYRADRNKVVLVLKANE